jgi:glycosyltransferase involved in cell wall biosynthesis
MSDPDDVVIQPRMEGGTNLAKVRTNLRKVPREVETLQVIFLTGSLRVGGTERNILHLATRLDPKRFSVEVWSDYEGEPIQLELRARGIPCRSLKGAPSLGEPFLKRLFLRNLPYQWRLWRMLRARRGAVIHAFGFPMAYYAVILGRLAGCRRVVYSVQDWDLWKRSGVYSLLDRVISRLAALAIADGEGARRLACVGQGMDPRRMVTIYDGVDTEELRPRRDPQEIRRELGLEPDRLTIGMIARLDIAKKGQDTFLTALPIAHRAASGVQFVMVGDGPDRAEIERLCAELPPELRPAMPGFRSDLGQVLNALDVLVIPSRWESVPKILLEAMWLSRPVIAARVGDIPEILDDHCGVLVPPGDAQALAEAMTRLANDPALRARLGAAAHQRILSRRLTLEDSILRYEQIYSSLHGSAD